MKVTEAVRLLAEKLGHVTEDGPDCYQCGCTHGKVWPNYLESAEASERLLEAMPNGQVTRLPTSRSWACNHDWVKLSGGYGFGKAFGMEHKHKGTAILLAALA